MENTAIVVLSILLNITCIYLWWISSSVKTLSNLVRAQADVIDAKDKYIKVLENSLKLRDEILLSVSRELSKDKSEPFTPENRLRIVKDEESDNGEQ